MPNELETPDYKGKDRRNGSKLRLGFQDYVKILLLAGGAIIWCSRLEWVVSANATDLEENKERIETCEKIDAKRETQVTLMQADLSHIKEDVKEVALEQKQLSNEMREGFLDIKELINKMHQ